MKCIYEIFVCGDGYDTFNTIIGYADNKEKADELIEQAKVLNPYFEYDKKEVKINFLFTAPYVREH